MRMPRTGRGLHPKITASSLSAWHFDETSTTTTNDKVNNNRNLAAVGALALPTIALGRIGNSFSFNGTTQIIGRNITTSADQNLGLGECTLSIVFRMLGVPFDEDQVLFRIGGPTNTETIAFNETFCARVVRGPLSTDAPLLNFRWESGAGVDQPSAAGATLSTVPLLVGQTYVAHFIKKTNGANFDMIIAVNGRQSVVATNLPQTTPGSADLGGTNRILFGAAVNSTPAIVDPANVQICSAMFSSRAYTEAECAEEFRRAAGYALPTSVHSRVLLANQSDVMINVSDPTLVQDDLLSGLSISDSVSDACAAADVGLTALAGDLSLAQMRGDSKLNNPTQAGSFTPVLDPFRRIDIECARVPHWLSPTTSDWWLKFRGRTDAIDDSADPVSIQSRDQGGFLADKWIENLNTYPKTFGGGGCGGAAQAREIVIEEVMQDNLTSLPFAPSDERNYFTPALAAATPGANAAIWVPFPSQSCVLPTKEGAAPEERDTPVPRSRLLDAMQQFASGIAWVVNFKKFDPLLEQFRLTAFDPNALKFAPDVVLSSADVVSTGKSRVSIENVRNKSTVVFASSTVGDANQNRLPDSRTRLDTDVGLTSRQLYGTRAIDLTEDAGSYINTPTEAIRLADAVLRDLSMPLRDSSHEIATMPELDAGDMAYFMADGITSTSPRVAAVDSCSMSMDAAQSSTSIECQGQPNGGKSRWLESEAGKTGKVPARSPFEATQLVGTRTLLPAITSLAIRTNWLGNIAMPVKNNSFTQMSYGPSFPPDSWLMRVGEWNGSTSDPRILATTDTESGNRALEFQRASGDTQTSPEIASQMFSINGRAGNTYSFEVVWKFLSTLSAAPRPIALRLEWRDENKALISSADPGWTGGVHTLNLRADESYLWTARNYETFSFPSGITAIGSLPANTWITSRVDGVRPPSGGAAKYLSIVIMASEATTVAMPADEINQGGFVVDEVRHWLTKQSLRARPASNHAIPTVDTWTNIRFNEANLIGGFYDRGAGLHTGGWPGTGYGFKANKRGRYKIAMTVAYTSALGNSGRVRVVRGATYNANGTVNAAGTELTSGLAALTSVTGKDMGGTGGALYSTLQLNDVVDLEAGDIIKPEILSNATGGIVMNATNSNTIAQTWSMWSVELIDDI